MTIAAESATAARIPAESATRSANRGKNGNRLHHIVCRPAAGLQATYRACAGRLRRRFLTSGKNGNHPCRSFISVALRVLRVEPSYSGKNGNQENDMARAKTWPLLATYLRVRSESRSRTHHYLATFGHLRFSSSSRLRRGVRVDTPATPYCSSLPS